MTMGIRTIFRNRMAGFIFGRYNLKRIASDLKTEEEEYISGIEIIHFNELIYLITAMIFIGSLLLFYLISFIFIILIIFLPFLIYIGMELELVMLTTERVLIEKRTIIEKLTRTQQLQTISVDQIAMITYGRSPLNYAALIIGLVGTIMSGIPFIVNNMELIKIDNVTLGIVIIFFLFPSIYLVWFGLRLYKRSIELSIIGLKKPVGIGRKKGAALWFYNDIQYMIFERIHHIFHQEPNIQNVNLEVEEFPLEYSALVKDLLQELTSEISRNILLILDKSVLTKEQILEKSSQYSSREVEGCMVGLLKMNLITYEETNKNWALNRNLSSEEISNSQKEAENY